MKTIAYLGPPGTFSEEAALSYASGSPDARCMPFTSIPAVVTAIETRVATAGVLPIENMLEGSVTSTLDLLIHETGLHIVGETVIPIRQYLAARTDLALEQIEVIYAHTQSLGQCRRFLERCLPSVPQIASLSNSAALADAFADGRVAAAITTHRAAQLREAAILAQDIADNRWNVTRFVVLAPEDQDMPPTGDDKTSFCFGFRADHAGLLVNVLEELAHEKINMTKMESRPSKEVLGQYIFLVDIEGHQSEPHIARALERIVAKTGMFKVFGSYPRWREPKTQEER
ncbi:MAG: prephenate dehydratase [Chloroflexaceae bacterium]|nr:prephenate dehydratase [Chloroflexaceae bacterium]